MPWPFIRSNPASAAKLPDNGSATPETRFTLKLFHELARRDSSANIFFSPCSMLCLAMVYDGARGATRDGMANALELAGLDADGVERVIARLRSALQGHEDGCNC